MGIWIGPTKLAHPPPYKAPAIPTSAPAPASTPASAPASELWPRPSGVLLEKLPPMIEFLAEADSFS